MDSSARLHQGIPVMPDPQAAWSVGATDWPLLELGSWELLLRAASRFPESDAIVSPAQQKKLSYAELVRQAQTVAAGLLAIGIAPGDRVGIWSANRAEWIVVQFAAAKIGAILVNVNPAYLEGELQYVMEDSGCKALAMASRYRGKDCLQAALNVRAKTPQLTQLILVDEVQHDGFMPWLELLRLGNERLQHKGDETFECQPRAAANLQYTSGTTGRPKGTTLSHHGLVNNAALISRRLGLSETDRVCLPVPLFHCFGMVIGVLGAVWCGAAVVMPSETFDVMTTMKVIESERCTAVYAVPTMFIAMLTHPEFSSERLKSLDKGLMGGSLCPASVVKDTVEKMHMTGMSLVYGLTETSPISLQTFPDDALADKQESVGRVHDHTEVRVVDPDQRKVQAPGQIGELQVRGYLVMLGYWNNPEATSNTIDAEGWLTTGDRAIMNERGFVQIVGRSKEMVIRGGENIYPRETEEALRTLPGVADAQVFGIPDSYYGEQLCAWIRPMPGVTLDEQELKAECKKRIAAYKIPYYIRFVEEFPSTASGKVQKFRMREIEMAQRNVEG
ncbi:AMP-binding protein [Lacisediminimonas profundi]|uniref:AMP-binding protein n=1 Tax=Lacisediminimonas profundi TaxID=2603856 RepID=UPI001386D9F6|nr:AMP-binding protein [Lacisediminimonas profundi]